MVITLRKGASKREIKKTIRQLEALESNRKGFDAHKYCGVLKIKEDALNIQKRLRNEWD